MSFSRASIQWSGMPRPSRPVEVRFDLLTCSYFFLTASGAEVKITEELWEELSGGSRSTIEPLYQNQREGINVKITRNGTTIIDTEDNKNRWRLRDVKQGEVFRFLKGKEDNLYIMGENRSYFYLGTNQVFCGGERETRDTGNSYVVKYPNATLELGEEQDKRPIEREKIPLVRIAPPEEE